MKVDDLVDRILGSRGKNKTKKKRKVLPKMDIQPINDQVIDAGNEFDKDLNDHADTPQDIHPDHQEIRQESLKQMEILDQVLGQECKSTHNDYQREVKNPAKIGKYLGIDCEMVGTGEDGANSVLARVSIVNYHGNTVLDEYVKAKEKITDYRTWVSGIFPHHLKDASDFEIVQRKIADLLKDRILVGHALKNDLKVLMLNHPLHMIRDTSKYAPFRKYSKGRHPALKTLAKELLGLEIQGGKHCSVEDAKVTMLIFKKVKTEWEAKFKNKSYT